MSDEFTELINGAVGDFHANEAASAGLLPAVATVRATVARRRKVRLTIQGGCSGPARFRFRGTVTDAS